MHRNLYLAPHKEDPDDTACPFCGQHQNQLHLTKCPDIRQKYWDPIITLMKKMGLPRFTHTSALLAVGRLSDTQVIDKNLSGILFLAWRCLYAELVRGRVENVTPVQIFRQLTNGLQTRNHDEHLQIEVLRRKVAQVGPKEQTYREQFSYT